MSDFSPPAETPSVKPFTPEQQQALVRLRALANSAWAATQPADPIQTLFEVLEVFEPGV